MNDEEFNRKNHWNNIYGNKQFKDTSWYEEHPVSIELIKEMKLPLEAKIIDIGGGESFLVDKLIDLGYTNITVLDISKKALDKVKKRLGEKASLIKWIESDVISFTSSERYDLWHDRAAFHFLTSKGDIVQYLEIANKSIKEKGSLLIGAFSENGPKSCSGLPVKQYSIGNMNSLFNPFFEKKECKTIDHRTPFETAQNFTFCRYEK